MRLSFYPLSRRDAEAIAGWHYDGQFSEYGTPADKRESTIEYFLDSGNRFFGAYQDGELIGFCSVGRDGQVQGGVYDESAVDVGAGMRPDLIGHGSGASFLLSVAAFVESVSDATALRATIASWNQRGLCAARTAGFSDQCTFVNRDGKHFTILVRARQC